MPFENGKRCNVQLFQLSADPEFRSLLGGNEAPYEESLKCGGAWEIETAEVHYMIMMLEMYLVPVHMTAFKIFTYWWCFPQSQEEKSQQSSETYSEHGQIILINCKRKTGENTI